MDRDEEIRQRAYHLWEQEGRPEGHALDHWRRAEREWESSHSELSGFLGRTVPPVRGRRVHKVPEHLPRTG